MHANTASERNKVAKAILRFLQLTVEGHLGPTSHGTFIPKALASAIWEHAETNIRSMLPCMACTMRRRSQLLCPTYGPYCIAVNGGLGVPPLGT